jgi:polyisoprenyl-teichoic acid--peptidoglycan teichoic acid transferase
MADAANRGGARRAPRSVRMSRRERRDLQQARSARRRGLGPEPAGVQRTPSGPARTPSGTSADSTGPRARGGRRVLRPEQRRTRGLAGTLGLTVVGAAIPGIGYLFAGRKVLGWLVLLGWAAVGGGALWYFGADTGRMIDLALDPTLLKVAAVVLGLLLTVWAIVVWTSYRLVRPDERPRWHTAVGNIAVVVVCLAFALPVVRVAQYAVATADFVGKVFEDNLTATTPDDVTEENPWGDRRRVNVLLLGGDGGDGRDGVRTDSMILLSIDTRSGRTTTFSLPRNMEKAQFPPNSALAEIYPYGFTDGTPGSGEYMLNAVYRNVPALHPEVLGKSANEGADAIKQAVEGTLAIPVHYYVLVNLDGFKQVVDAMGGVTVNINEPVAIGGDTSAGIPPSDYLEPGPNQHLDGFHALWYSRGRWGSDDYERMERQRCMIDAIIDAAEPRNLLVRYLDLLDAGEQIVTTDIPQDLASAFVDLGLKVKSQPMKSVVFQRSEQFNSGDPDFEYVRERVQRALHPKKAGSADSPDGTATSDPSASAEPADPETPDATTTEEAAEDAADACAYHPVDEDATGDSAP